MRPARMNLIVAAAAIGIDGEAHPRMNAALEFGTLAANYARSHQRLAMIDKNIIGTRGLRNQLAIHHFRAFRAGNRVSRGCVQGGDKSSAKLSDPRKGVGLAAAVDESHVDAFFGF